MLTGDVLNVQGVRGGAVVGIAVDQVDRSPVSGQIRDPALPRYMYGTVFDMGSRAVRLVSFRNVVYDFPRMQYRKVTRHHSVFNFLHELLKITLKERVRDDHPSVRL